MSALPDTPRTPWMKSPLFWLLLALFVAIFVGRTDSLDRQPGQAMQAKRGYKAAVDQLIAKGCLKPGAQSGRRRIVFAKGRGCPTAQQLDAYAGATFLSRDMAGLVEQRWQFGGDGPVPELRAIRASAHGLRFAAGDQGLWGGNVLYAKGYGQPAPGTVWGGRLGVKENLTNCGTMRIDGKSGQTVAELNQYVLCGGEFWQRVARIQSISERNGSTERVREPSLASAAKRLEAPGMAGDVDSSIRYTLHVAMQDILDSHLAKTKNTPGKREKTVRAGVLLMDGITGEIHAAATHPIGQQDVGTDGQSNWLSKNWNFERLPVGSTAKIPFAAAIVDANTALLKQGPRPGLKPKYCGGVQNCKDRAVEQLGLNFTDFIALSSNGHALWLLDQARLGNADGWKDNLRRFACVEPDLARRDPSCADTLWMTKEGLPLGEPEALLKFDLNNARTSSLYYDYYITILGGIKSSWTSANLAQSYARIFSDRPVNPRLTLATGPANGAATGTVGMDIAAWLAIRNGMAAVLVDPRGTGRKLCSTLACINGNQIGGLWLYAKTGTATIAREGDNSKTLVLLAVSTKTGAAPQSPQDIATMKVIVISQRFSGSGTEPVDLAAKMFGNTAFRKWIGLQSAPDKAGRLTE